MACLSHIGFNVTGISTLHKQNGASNAMQLGVPSVLRSAFAHRLSLDNRLPSLVDATRLRECLGQPTKKICASFGIVRHPGEGLFHKREAKPPN